LPVITWPSQVDAQPNIQLIKNNCDAQLKYRNYQASLDLLNNGGLRGIVSRKLLNQRHK